MEFEQSPRATPLHRPLVAADPDTHPEPVDLLGVATKLIEAGGLVLALRLLSTRAGGVALPALHEGADR